MSWMQLEGETLVLFREPLAAFLWVSTRVVRYLADLFLVRDISLRK